MDCFLQGLDAKQRGQLKVTHNENKGARRLERQGLSQNSLSKLAMPLKNIALPLSTFWRH